MADTIVNIAAVLIFLAIILSIIRLVIGKTLVDRIVAIDMLTVISISLVALYAHVSGRFIYIDVALVYGLLSFLSVLAIARYPGEGSLMMLGLAHPRRVHRNPGQRSDGGLSQEGHAGAW